MCPHFTCFLPQSQFIVALQMMPYIVGLYGLLIFAGGIMGYLKAGSEASLVMGGISGLLLLISSGGMLYCGRLENVNLGCVKASRLRDRKASCISLIQRALRSRSPESFHASPNSHFQTDRSISKKYFKRCVFFSLILTFILDAFFSYRFMTTMKFLPSGLLALLSVGIIIGLVAELRRSSK